MSNINKIDAIDVEAVVKQVLESMAGFGTDSSGTASPAGQIPKTARVAMLTALEKYEVKEFPMPEVGDGDILVKVEGCGICGTDAHEFKRDPFGFQVADIEHCGTFTDQYVIGKPPVQVNIVVGKKPVYVGASYVLFIQVKHSNVRIIFEDHAGNYFVPNL